MINSQIPFINIPCVQCQWAVTNCISTAHRQTGSSCWWLLHWNIRLGWFFFNIAKMVLWKLEHIEIEAKNDFWRQIWSLKSHISEMSRILKKMMAEFWFIKLFTLFSEKKSWFLIFLLFSKMIFYENPSAKQFLFIKAFIWLSSKKYQPTLLIHVALKWSVFRTASMIDCAHAGKNQFELFGFISNLNSDTKAQCELYWFAPDFIILWLNFISFSASKLQHEQ